MKINPNRKNQGFTLIEMIGVLAVIAILAAVLIPKVFEAINNSRVSNAAITCNTAKTAIADHYAKFGSLAVDGSGTTPTAIGATTAYDNILLKEGFMDKPFAVKIGDGVVANNHVSLTVVGTTPSSDMANGVYCLGGGVTVFSTAGAFVAEAIISGATLEDAAALDKLIDGPDTSMSSPASTGTDLQGRVKWAQVGTTGLYDINVYLTHR